MFLRKLVVIVLPLAMAALLSFLLPVMDGMPFWTEVFKGLTLGAALALLLPLCGSTRKREPFTGLMWTPLIALSIAVLGQYLYIIGISIPVLELLHTSDSQVVLVESLFIGYMGVQLLRTKK